MTDEHDVNGVFFRSVGNSVEINQFMIIRQQNIYNIYSLIFKLQTSRFISPACLYSAFVFQTSLCI